MKTTRRNFIRQGSAISLGFLGLYQFTAACVPGAKSDSGVATANAGYGELTDDPDGILRLPKGFSYKIISRQGDTMSDGLLVPGLPDGMATFDGGNGKTIIIRNHENSPGKYGAFGENNELLHKIDKQKFYDYGNGEMPCTGGTTTLVYDHRTKKVEKEFLSLAGTIRNCAGGPTPWNSWITCEETVQRANGILEKDHGYTFEVPASLEPGLAEPLPIKGMGRFNHEAIAIDPASGVVYLTEDDGEGLIYRYIPNTPGALLKGGKLQALMIQEQRSFDTRNWENAAMQPKKRYQTAWIDLDNTDAPDDDLRFRGFGLGAARFARGEGMWFGNNEIYFACTNGGAKKTGQIFRYKPSPYEGTSREKESPATLELFAEPNDQDILKNCDNLTVAPWGDIILCEDHKHPFIVGITPDGQYFKVGENVGYETEFAGAVFSPDGSTLFVNIQGAGLTLAIEGPWRTV